MDGKDLMPLYDNPEQGHHAWLPLINVWGPSAVHGFFGGNPRLEIHPLAVG